MHRQKARYGRCLTHGRTENYWRRKFKFTFNSEDFKNVIPSNEYMKKQSNQDENIDKPWLNKISYKHGK